MALAGVRREIRANEVQQRALVRQQKHTLEQAGEAAKHVKEARALVPYYQYERYLARVAVALSANLAQLRTTEETRRKELEEAMKRRRTVERLKERMDAAFNAELEKEARKLLDEVATNRATMDRIAAGQEGGPER